jgi:hypothetical protein
MPGFAGSASGNRSVPQSRIGGPSPRATPNIEPFQYPYSIGGVTRDANGVALGNCPVKLYRKNDDSVAGVTVSDASGNFRVSASPLIQHFWRAETVDGTLAGTTVSTLVGT